MAKYSRTSRDKSVETMALNSRTWYKFSISKSFTFVSHTLVVGVVVVLFTPFVEFLVKPLIIDEEPQPSNVIIVLSSDFYKSGLPDMETLVRLRKAIQLVEAGWATKIICAGGLWLDDQSLSIAQSMKDTLVINGRDASDILVYDDTINTYNDIHGVLRKYSQTFNLDDSLIVTSAYHTRRVKLILKKMGLKSRVISAEPIELMPRAWSSRLPTFHAVVREYLALLYFKSLGYI